MTGKKKDTKSKLLSAKSPRLKGNLKRTYSQQDKEVKDSAKKNKNDYIERLATDAEEAAARQDMGTLVSLNLSTEASNMQKLQSGNMKGNRQAVWKRSYWKEHFERVLTRDDPSVEAEISLDDEILDIDTGN